MSAEETKQVAQRFAEEMFNKGNFEAAAELLDPNLTGSLGVTGQQITAEGLVAAIKMLRTAFPDYHSTTEEIVTEGDRVMVRWTTRGTHQGDLRSPLGAIRPTGRQVEYAGVSIARIAGGKIVEFMTLADNLTLLQQLGVIPVPVPA